MAAWVTCCEGDFSPLLLLRGNSHGCSVASPLREGYAVDSARSRAVAAALIAAPCRRRREKVGRELSEGGVSENVFGDGDEEKKTRRPKSLKRTQQQKIENRKKNSTKSKTKKRETKLKENRRACVLVLFLFARQLFQPC